MAPEDFDLTALFDEDYLYFYEPLLTDERSDAETDLIWRLLELQPGLEVLDLACGHGRIANRLAQRGCRVTGLDATPLFLERARHDAARRGVSVTYVLGDMRRLPWAGRFDRIVNWFTAFGFFDDEDNRRVLEEAHRALKPGGRLLIEHLHLARLLAEFSPSVIMERDGDLLVDRSRYDPLTGRLECQRTIVRQGRVRRFRFFIRLFGFPELRDWLRGAGFRRVEGYGEDGRPLTHDSRRMIVVAER